MGGVSIFGSFRESGLEKHLTFYIGSLAGKEAVFRDMWEGFGFISFLEYCKISTKGVGGGGAHGFVSWQPRGRHNPFVTGAQEDVHSRPYAALNPDVPEATTARCSQKP